MVSASFLEIDEEVFKYRPPTIRVRVIGCIGTETVGWEFGCSRALLG